MEELQAGVELAFWTWQIPPNPAHPDWPWKLTPQGLRSCGRASNNQGCWPTVYDTGAPQYSRVCGRVRGYQFGVTQAFLGPRTINTINDNYVYGVSLTHGPSSSRTHIWSFAAGVSEVDNGHINVFCPCVTATANLPPTVVGNDYFCESGRNTPFGWSSGYNYSILMTQCGMVRTVPAVVAVSSATIPISPRPSQLQPVTT